MVEGGLHRNDLLQLVAHRLDVLCLEHIGIHRTLIGILGINVPTAEHDIVEAGHRDNLPIVEIALPIATADADLIVLGHGTHGLRQPLANHQDTCHECGGNSSVANNQNSQLPFGWSYVCLIHFAYFVFIHYSPITRQDCVSPGLPPERRGHRPSNPHPAAIPYGSPPAWLE